VLIVTVAVHGGLSVADQFAGSSVARLPDDRPGVQQIVARIRSIREVADVYIPQDIDYPSLHQVDGPRPSDCFVPSPSWMARTRW
jgi:hypothetical protein